LPKPTPEHTASRRHRAGLYLAGVAMFGFLTFYFWTRQFAVLEAPAATLMLEDRHGQFLSEAGSGDLGFWRVQTLPPRLKSCLLRAEDQRFYAHRGVDLRAIVRALANNLTGGRRQGGSTIAMQVARLQRPGPRTYPRKFFEMAVAWHLIDRYGHDRVLAHYVRLMPQGRRIHGAAYAARRYFQKPLIDISWAEAALLTALPQAPGRMNLYRPDGLAHAKARARRILQAVYDHDLLTQEAWQAAKRQLKNYRPPEREIRPFHSLHAIHRIQSEVAGRAGFSSVRPVRTTLDLNLQDKLDHWAATTLERLRGLGAGNIAVMVVTRETGAVRGYIGSDWYDDQTHAGAINYATTPRSSGSTLKPFLYALGLETEAFHPNSILADLPLLMVDSSGHYGVTNFDQSHLGPMLYRKALANSRNIPAVSVLRELGTFEAYEFLGEFGLADQRFSHDFYGLGMAIGGVYVTLEKLVTAYLTLASEGEAIGLRWFPGNDGNGGDAKRVLSEATARNINLFLSDPQARLPSFPRGRALEYNFPVAVKTGTSQGFRDAWCVAFSRDYVVGAWIGRPDHEPMNKISGTHAAKLVHRIMTHLHPEADQGVGTQPFPKPRHSKAIRLCALTGQLASPDCDQVALEYWPDTKPLPVMSQAHQRFAIDLQTGHQAGPTTPPERIRVRKALVLPGAYAVWASKKGFGPPQPAQATMPRAQLKIQFPVAGSRLHLDPGTPSQFQTLPLRAVVEPALSEIVWFVDGEPYQTVRYPYQARWQLEPGEHRFQVRLPRANIQSEVVTLTVFP